MTEQLKQAANPRALIDLTGMRFGRWAVICRSINQSPSQPKWECICDCGNKKQVFGHSLRYGVSKSCGCLGAEMRQKAASTQNGLGRTKTAEIWRSMKSRCHKVSDPSYARYGGRGISVCTRWHVFANFLEDMGHAPTGLSIERLDNDGDYSPGNCMWATRTQQARNKRNTLRWNGKALADIADESGIGYDTLFSRLKKFGTPFPEHLVKP